MTTSFGFRERRRARLRRTPLTESQRRVLERCVVWLEKLPAHVREQPEGLPQIFLAEKHSEGCDGLVVTDAMRLVIATQVCMLLVGRHADVCPGLKTIFVYPHTYVAPVRSNPSHSPTNTGNEPNGTSAPAAHLGQQLQLNLLDLDQPLPLV